MNAAVAVIRLLDLFRDALTRWLDNKHGPLEASIAPPTHSRKLYSHSLLPFPPYPTRYEF